MTRVALTNELLAARARLRVVADDLAGPREFGPRIAIANPPRWEIGHIGWFQEYWCLRAGGSDRVRASILPNADALYNSATVAHDTRWTLALPDFDATLRYRDSVLGRTLEKIARDTEGNVRYYAQLAARHEDMHAEAFHYMRQTWGYDPPALPAQDHPRGNRMRGDVEVSGGTFEMGAAPGRQFLFDNERTVHPVVIRPFRIARTAVTNAEYLEFVTAGGYRRQAWWTPAGWTWLQAVNRSAPRYWEKIDGNWVQRRFDRLLAIEDDEPVVHISAHEAQAYCNYASRRLPTEAEWEYAATWNAATATKQAFPWGDRPWRVGAANLENATLASVDAYPAGDSPCGCRQMVGNVWEWTASRFLPYAGFLRDPYKEYSEPWFGTHTVLRGGCFTTSARIATSTYRNFFTADRADVFAGLRTCAR